MSEPDFGYGMRTGARCAVHLEQVATRTCTRCGSFMCEVCSQAGTQPLCPACLARAGGGESFPLDRHTWNFSALWNYCFAAFKREWVMLSVGMFVSLMIGVAAQIAAQALPAIGGLLDNMVVTVILTVVAFFVQTVVQGIVGLGLMRMMLDVLQGQRADIGRLFSQFHKLGTYIVTTLLIFAMLALPLAAEAGILWWWFGDSISDLANNTELLFTLIGVVALSFIPLVYFALPLYLLQAEMAYKDGVSPMQLIRNCYAYARGERLSIFGVTLVGGLLIIAGLLACCVGAIPALGFFYLLLAGLYLALRNGAEEVR